MSIVEQLGLFVSFFQSCAMIPFIEERHPVTKKLQKFSFSFKNVCTWWFIVILCGQLTLPCVFIQLMMDFIKNFSQDKEIPITLTISCIISTLSAFIQVVLCRWIVIRHYRNFKSVLDAILRVEDCLRRTCRRHQSSGIIRFWIGFFLIFSSVSMKLGLFNTFYLIFFPLKFLVC